MTRRRPVGVIGSAMTRGTTVRIKPEFVPFYRKRGTPLQGRVVSVSPSGTVARVHLDDVADSWVRTDHLERYH